MFQTGYKKRRRGTVEKRLDLSLYLITDEKIPFNQLLKAVEQALKNGITVLQYRAKEKTSKEMYQEAVALKKLCHRYNVPFIVNDRVDIALSVDADGVHLGQDDLDVEVARGLLGWDKVIGLSTKNIQQVIQANSLPVDYIGFGSVFPTLTKADAKTVGLEALKEAVKLSIQPVVAIGGINLSNVKDVIKAGSSGVAVVSAILKDIEKVGESTKILKRIITEVG
ncbi:MAG: thiamine phosphate synthase [Aquificae bacterium]|nr:thiamine phosphate synthase [Aquificota bacterium]